MVDDFSVGGGDISHLGLVGLELEVDEAVELSGEGPADVAAHVGDGLPAAAGLDEGDGPAVDLQVLEVVIVSGDVEVEAALFEDRAPFDLKDAVVAVAAVGEEGV